MPNQIRDLYTIDETSFPYIFEQNVTVHLKAGEGLIRCNVYRPKESGPVPVLVTYGPYGKDIHYKDFHAKSFAEVNPKHKSAHSAWETPDPGFWTPHGYAVVRADERGTGQSPGLLDTMSRGTTDAFCELIEWAADQAWSSGKVGLLGGFLRASSRFKYLRAIVGRHDLPFYYDDEVEVQRSFLDAFLKGDDRVGWSVPGKLPPVDLVLRKGNVGFNDAVAERAYRRRTETEWPPARTRYTKFFLTPDLGLDTHEPQQLETPRRVSYRALGTIDAPQLVQFTTAPFTAETEITGHPLLHLNVSATAETEDGTDGTGPSDIDLFITLRHIGPDGAEVLYTGTAGDPVPLCKGWLRVSLRATDASRSSSWLPHREYRGVDAAAVIPGEVYGVDVEVWPTCVVVEAGGRVVLEVASGDTQGSGLFLHDDPADRSREVFGGMNHVGPASFWISNAILSVLCQMLFREGRQRR
ncbi:hypothetical protein MAPG_06096 [Magnaporthiopsis poae ATCC 64411]|uniref:Xaa-Pro dipeptidyl-peptidase C-terminal domain-containing protein n=1 Tax=Magnaporthiopsis poae (strain ATCC 64411 / 73-15) TaxID=644358 RepID=A0A0C4E148_MAGP6|nr:hypothetical protein MAPG_06096 [Magnaporthiopsis poae ATCC 64411]